MKIQILILAIVGVALQGSAQEKIFSLGYGKTFVSKDSSTMTIVIDMNRTPGTSNASDGYYFVNTNFSKTPQWAYYVKPSMDINLGSGVSSSPNNVSVAMPFGLVYDLTNGKSCIGLSSVYFEGSPEITSDRLFSNTLYDFSIGPYFKSEWNLEPIVVDLITGISAANGVRNQRGLSTDYYGRINVPIILKLAAWTAVSDSGKLYKRIKLSNTIKLNDIYADDFSVTTEKTYFFDNTQFDFYLTAHLGINITYNLGKAEPLFKQNNSFSIGITLAR